MAYEVKQNWIISDNLEVPVVSHCNLSCRGCNHLSPVARPTIVDPNRLDNELRVLGKCYFARVLRLTGGEPLLHPAIADIAACCRRSGVAASVHLVTNGVLIDRVPDATWRYIDALEVSAYGDRFKEGSSIDRLRSITDEKGIALLVRYFVMFREPYAALPTTDPELTKRIYTTCQIAHTWGCHNINGGYFYKWHQAYGIAGSSEHSVSDIRPDGVKLDDGNLCERITKYLADKTPLAACANCLGTVGKAFTHIEIPRREWRGPQQHCVEDLVDWEYLKKLETADQNPDWGVVEGYAHNAPSLYRRAVHKLTQILG